MKSFIPKVIYIEPEADQGKYAEEILNKLPDVPRKYVDDFNKVEIPEFLSEKDEISVGKEILLLRRYKGLFMKKCPGTKGLLCCNYHVINAQTNCHFDCSYCSLQNYLNTQAMVIYTNVEDMLLQVEEHLATYPNRRFRVGTGELADSLALDQLTNLSKIMVPFFAKQKNVFFELKTKSNTIENLKDLNHNGNTVIAFSVNIPEIIESDEHFTASLQERLNAAKTVQSWGYKLAFHFDPVVLFEGYQPRYASVIKAIYDTVDKNKIQWISMGGFRYSREIQSAMRERFPESKLLLGEFWPCEDQKMRYLKTERTEIYRFIRDEMIKHDPHPPLYMCMESKQMWLDVFGYLPQIDETTGRLFDFR